MAYALQLGLRYLRSKKRATISVITMVAIGGVALGVAALLVVMSITSGFQDEFRSKVLGVNAHVLVLKYGRDFEEYRDVIARTRRMPEVAGAAPFVINEMMLAKGDRLQGVLVKGVDPTLMPTVLDLPEHMIEGSMIGLRRQGAAPPTRPEDLTAPFAEEDELDSFLEGIARHNGDTIAGHGGPFEGDIPIAGDLGADVDAGVAVRRHAAWERVAAVGPENGTGPGSGPDAGLGDALTEVHVPTPAEAEAAMSAADEPALPNDALEQQLLAEVELQANEPDHGPLPGLVLGVTLARSLGINVGDRVQVISPLSGLDTSLWRPGGGAPRSRDFRVIGIFQAGFQEYDSHLVYVDLYEAQQFIDEGDTVMGVELRLHDIDAAPEVSRRVERMLGGGPYHTLDWKELNHNLFTALEIQKVILSLVIATIIFVAAFNVVATLIMIVLEKRREIAILKAMGARDGGILAIFMVQGSLVGFVGTALGIALGGGVAFYLERYHFPLDPKVYLIDHLPVRASAWEYLATTGIALGICIVATLAPSWWAARLLPADGVRYE